MSWLKQEKNISKRASCLRLMLFRLADINCIQMVFNISFYNLILPKLVNFISTITLIAIYVELLCYYYCCLWHNNSKVIFVEENNNYRMSQVQ